MSIAAISTLVYAIIQAPERGWTSTSSIVNFVVGAAMMVVFVGWEIRRDDPMLDMTLFRNRGFSAGSIALALLFCGLNATVTATLAGQIVMEGFLRLRLPPVLRRLVTRLIAIIPAIVVTWLYGSSGTAQLLVLSQVVLSIQLPFAVIPLMLFAQDRKRLGAFAAPAWQVALGWATAAVIVGLNMKLLFDAATG